MIFMKNIKNVDIVYKKSAIWRNLVNENYSYFNTDLAITTSVGVALYPDAGRDSRPRTTSADIALYQAKDKGKNQFHIYNGSPAESRDIHPRDYGKLVIEKIYRARARSSPYENIRAAIKILCYYYGFRQDIL